MCFYFGIQAWRWNPNLLRVLIVFQSFIICSYTIFLKFRFLCVLEKKGSWNTYHFSCFTFSILLFLQVILTIAEHHSAIVPWQLVAQKTGAILKFVNLDETESPDIEKLRQMLSRKTKIVVVHHVSNVLGIVLSWASSIWSFILPYWNFSSGPCKSEKDVQAHWIFSVFKVK